MPATPHFPNDMPLREARAEWFRINNLPPDGGLSAKWVRLESKPIPLYFPNTAARKRAVPLHDLHHIAAPFDTTWIGEAEIGAWEIGGSCRGYLAAWILNMGALTYGPFLAPRRVFRAFVRGRHTRNLYTLGYNEIVLNETVGQFRRRLNLDAPTPKATPADTAAFILWLLLSWLLWDVPILAAIALGAYFLMHK
jgi:hypothetical protein